MGTTVSPWKKDFEKSQAVKPKCNVPNVGTGRRVLTAEQETELSFQRAKYARKCVKSEADIRAEMDADPEWARTMPAPARPPMGNNETVRLQRLREFNGRLPEEHQPVISRRKAAPREPATEHENLEEMFDAVSAEIQEWEEFLARPTICLCARICCLLAASV